MNIENTDFINGGNGYMDFSDFIIISDKTQFNQNILKKDAVIFCKYEYLNALFDNLRFSKNNYILITHFSDYHINQRIFNTRPPCIKKWYASAVNYDHPDLIPIPVGFSVRYNYEKWPETFIEKENWFLSNTETLKNQEKNEEIVYCNYTIDHLRPPRHLVMPKMEQNGVKCYMPPKKQTDVEWGSGLSYEECYIDMAKYKFIASPPGNGIDAHRTWDSLYLGGIPIVIKHTIFKNYDLPMLQINDYSEVTNDLLKNYLEYYNKHQFDYEPLRLSYWKKNIEVSRDFYYKVKPL